MLPEQLAAVTATLSPCYAYRFPYQVGDEYHDIRDEHLAHSPLLSDTSGDVHNMSPNHGGTIIQILCQDGHVMTIATYKLPGFDEDVFHNDLGIVAAGVGRHDIVLGPSNAKPGANSFRGRSRAGCGGLPIARSVAAGAVANSQRTQVRPVDSAKHWSTRSGRPGNADCRRKCCGANDLTTFAVGRGLAALNSLARRLQRFVFSILRSATCRTNLLPPAAAEALVPLRLPRLFSCPVEAFNLPAVQSISDQGRRRVSAATGERDMQ